VHEGAEVGSSCSEGRLPVSPQHNHSPIQLLNTLLSLDQPRELRSFVFNGVPVIPVVKSNRVDNYRLACEAEVGIHLRFVVTGNQRQARTELCRILSLP
jgi:hypothetical protein